MAMVMAIVMVTVITIALTQVEKHVCKEEERQLAPHTRDGRNLAE